MLLKDLIEHPEFESIIHIIVIMFEIYIVYKFITDPSARTLSHTLLFSILLSVHVLIQQNINRRNKKKPKYGA